MLYIVKDRVWNTGPLRFSKISLVNWSIDMSFEHCVGLFYNMSESD